MRGSETRKTKGKLHTHPLSLALLIHVVCLTFILFTSYSLQLALMAEKAHIQAKVGRMCTF